MATLHACFTGWTFFTIIYCKKFIACLKKSKNKQKEAEDVPFKKEDSNLNNIPDDWIRTGIRGWQQPSDFH